MAMPPADTAPKPAAEPSYEAKRKKLLADPKLHAEILKVARARGMKRQDWGDLLGAVIEDALAHPSLPVDEPERFLKYVCGIANNKSLDAASARIRESERLVRMDARDADPRVVPADRVALAQQSIAILAGRWPDKYQWFVRSEIHGETSEAIAADSGVSAGFVRKVLSDMRKALREAAKHPVGMVITLLVVVLGALFGDPGRWPPVLRPTVKDSELSQQGPGRHDAPATPPSAAELRERARDWARQRNWALCIEDLDAVMRLDPASFGDADWALRTHAQEELDGGGAWAKPRLK